jgi:N-acetylmuramoyl-L-alanine amidase
MVALEAGSIPAPAAVLSEWRYDPAANQLEVRLQAQTTPQYFVLAQPPRIVLDLPNTLVGKVVTQQNYSGAVRKVRVSQFQPDVTRIVLELSPEVVLAVGQMQLQRAPSGKGDRWLLRPGITAQNTPNLPSTVPPVNGGSQQVVVTNVPPSATLPPAIVSVPPLTPSVNPGVSPAGEPYSKPVIEFGQPLPMTPDTTTPQLPVLQPGAPILPGVTSSTTPTATSTVVVPSPNSTTVGTSTANSQSPDILLPAGTQLSLRYAGNSLTLKAGSPQQAELLLRSDLRSPNGNLIAPAGTPVSGRFETNDNGSYFITQAIALQGRNIPFAAKSDILDRTASTTILKPEQILQIRLTENLSKF